MSVLQPLYFAGGRYTASIDRKLLTALIDPEDSGTRIGGVIPPSGSMAVTGTTTSNVTIATGFCVIPDSSSPSAASPGLYLCAVDSSSEVLKTLTQTTSPATRTDLIYASVSETSFTITNKSLTADVATLHTSAAHGFAVKQTVVISGVDEIFDGSYVIQSVPTSTTFTYDRTLGSNVTSAFVTPVVRRATSTAEVVITGTSIPATNQISFVTSTAGTTFADGETVTVIGVSSEIDGTYRVLASPAPSTTAFSVTKISSIAPSVGTITTTTNNPTSASKPISAVAKARVPFAIKIEEGVGGTTVPTLPAGTNLALASLLVTGTAVSSVKDLRKFTTGLGGVHFWNSDPAITTSNAPSGVQGHLRYDTYTNTLDIYDTTGTAGWRNLFRGDTGHHDDESTNASATALHHTLGTGQFNAAKGNHVHAIATTRYGLNTSIDYYDADGTDKSITSENSADPTIIKSSSALAVPANSAVLVIASGSVLVSSINSYAAFGIKQSNGTIESVAYVGDSAGSGTTSGYHNFSCFRYFTYSTAQTVTYQLAGYKDADSTSADTYNVFIHQLAVIPFSSITTDILS